jgi:hypothetical protein
MTGGEIMLKRTILLFLVFFALSSASVFAADCNNGGRYEDNGDGTVTDCKSGLIWLQNTNCIDTSGGVIKNNGNGTLTWYQARKWVAGLANGICSLGDGSSAGDWRLPTRTELMAMVESAKSHTPTAYTNPVLTDATGTAQLADGCTSGCIFNNLVDSYYWTSTYPYYTDTTAAWVVVMSDGHTDGVGMTSSSWVWPVRAGQDGSFGSLLIQ